MSRNFGALTTSAEVALVAATTKTVLQLIAPANTSLAVIGFEVSFDGVSNTAEPVIIQILRQTTAGTVTARTPLKTKDKSTALQSTGSENASVEPTAGDVLKTFHVHPRAGVLYPFNIDNEIEIAGGGRLGLKLTAPAAVNCLATINFEE